VVALLPGLVMVVRLLMPLASVVKPNWVDLASASVVRLTLSLGSYALSWL
jgi:hypothetical protein